VINKILFIYITIMDKIVFNSNVANKNKPESVSPVSSTDLLSGNNKSRPSAPAPAPAPAPVPAPVPAHVLMNSSTPSPAPVRVPAPAPAHVLMNASTSTSSIVPIPAPVPVHMLMNVSVPQDAPIPAITDLLAKNTKLQNELDSISNKYNALVNQLRKAGLMH